MEETEVEAAAYVYSSRRNDSSLSVSDRSRATPSRLQAFINVLAQVFSEGRMTEDELPLSSPS